MDIGLQHLFYAFALLWVLHVAYLLSLASRQKKLSDELRELRETLKRKGAE
ncbi:MAG: CcmD family protein [Terriglobia bacterium]